MPVFAVTMWIEGQGRAWGWPFGATAVPGGLAKVLHNRFALAGTWLVYLALAG